MDKKKLGILFLAMISNIFSEEKTIIWDFGVVINEISQPALTREKNARSPIKLSHQTQIFQNKALIADPFIAPTQKIILDQVLNPSILSKSSIASPHSRS